MVDFIDQPHLTAEQHHATASRRNDAARHLLEVRRIEHRCLRIEVHWRHREGLEHLTAPKRDWRSPAVRILKTTNHRPMSSKTRQVPLKYPSFSSSDRNSLETVAADSAPDR